jgi:hypothetical protein
MNWCLLYFRALFPWILNFTLLSNPIPTQGMELSDKNSRLKSCGSGNLDDCNQLGMAEHESGNITQAASIFKKSCDNGSLDG